MLFNCLFSSLNKEGRNKITPERASYIVMLNQHEWESGCLLLKVIIGKAILDTKGTVRTIRGQIANLDLYIAKVNYDITKFHTHVKTLIKNLASRGQKQDDLSLHLMKAYVVVPGQTFQNYIERLQDTLDGTDMSITPLTADQLMVRVENKYKAMLNDSLWNVESEESKRIVALEAQVACLKKSPRKTGSNREKAHQGKTGVIKNLRQLKRKMHTSKRSV